MQLCQWPPLFVGCLGMRLCFTGSPCPLRLTALKARVQDARMKAPLFDTKGYTHDLENLYSKMWERYEKRLPVDHILSWQSQLMVHRDNYLSFCCQKGYCTGLSVCMYMLQICTIIAIYNCISSSLWSLLYMYIVLYRIFGTSMCLAGRGRHKWPNFISE